MSATMHTLANGLRIVCDPVPGVRTIAVTAAVRGGARWEPPERSGWSHLLEHLVFKGAGDMGAREIVERIEGEGGSINAATGYERTSFEVRALGGSLDLGLQVISDLMLRPRLEAEEVEREKDVVAQEIAEAYDTPDDHVFEMAQTQAWFDQPLGSPILGSVESLALATPKGIASWRDRLYRARRTVVVVSGAVEEAQLLNRVEHWFGEAEGGGGDNPEIARFTGGEAWQQRSIEQANLVFQLPAVRATDPAYHATRALAEILGGGMASRLFQSAREERGLAYAIDAYHEPYEDGGVLGIFAGAAGERSEELAELCAAEVLALAETGPTAAELARAKAVMTAGLWMADESLASRAGRAAAQTLILGAPQPVEDQIARIEAVTVEALRDAARASVQPGLAAVAVLGPKAARKAGAAFTRRLRAG